MTNNITNIIRKQEQSCRAIFKVKVPKAVEVEAIVLALIAAGILECELKNDDKEQNERALIQLGTHGINYLIHDDNAWNRILFLNFKED